MSYTKDYYAVLGLDTQHHHHHHQHPTQISPADIRRAYKFALLAAHPDKLGPTVVSTSTLSQNTLEQRHQQQQRQQHTIDTIKEAYAILSDPPRKREYDAYMTLNPGKLFFHDDGDDDDDAGDAAAAAAVMRRTCRSSTGGAGGAGLRQDFLAGLEVLDLSDFHVLGRDQGCRCFSSSSSSSSSSAGAEDDDGDGDGDDGPSEARDGQRNRQMEWGRACRCGLAAGYKILEEELEEAEGRGESEVLVGCEGCSLWVRVGFGVEDC